MKSLPYDREQFEVLELIEAVGQRCNVNIETTCGHQAIDTFRTAIQRQLTPIAVHGRRVEAMFGYVAAALGRCLLIKKEECRLTFVEQIKLKIPDYRVVTKRENIFS